MSEELLMTIAKHLIENRLHWEDKQDLRAVISNKLGHDLNDRDLKIVEKHLKELRAVSAS